MPIYEYQCLLCKEKFEELIMGDSAIIKCPHCQSLKVEKLFSAFSFKSSGNFVSSKATDSCNTCSARTCSSCK